jgi:hypothetical protein
MQKNVKTDRKLSLKKQTISRLTGHLNVSKMPNGTFDTGATKTSNWPTCINRNWNVI